MKIEFANCAIHRLIKAIRLIISAEALEIPRLALSINFPSYTGFSTACWR